MKRNTWISLIIVAIIFGGGGYYFGSQSTASSKSTAASAYAGRSGGFAGRAGVSGAFGGAGGNATVGTIIATANGSFTVQLPASTSTTATTGTKIVLFDNSTTVDELESVPTSNLAVGQTVTVTGTTNSDGSVTATSIQVRPSMAGRGGTAPTATQ